MQHEIEVIASGHVPIGGEESAFKVRARSEAESQRTHLSKSSRSRPQTTNGRVGVLVLEPEVVGRGLGQEVHVHLHRVILLRTRDGISVRYPLVKSGIARNLPAHVDSSTDARPWSGVGFWRHASPDDHPVRFRIARGDAMLERKVPILPTRECRESQSKRARSG